MLSNLNVKLENIGPIGKADMDLAQINIIGGQNSTGKSTATKLLYSILRANCSKNKDLAYSSIRGKIAELVFDLNDYTRSNRRSNLDTHEEKQNKEEALDLLKKLSLADEFEETKEVFEEVKSKYDRLISKNVLKIDIEDQIDKIDKSIEKAETNPEEIYFSVMETLLKRELSLNLGNLNEGCFTFKGEYNDTPFKYIVNLNKDFNFDLDNVLPNPEGWFRVKEVYYMDSFSIIDLPQREGLQNTDHAVSLSKSLSSDSDKSEDVFDKDYNPKLRDLEKSIIDLMGGKFIYDEDAKKLIFKSKYEKASVMKNTASGIKQLGIIQLLLSHRLIDEDSFFIFDEPEVNLHPIWQVELAKFLVILSRELSLTIYVNSHSPFFIEALDLYSTYYGLIDKTRFFLTKPNDEGKFDFINVAHDNLDVIYSNLGEPYDILDEIRLEIEFGSLDDDEDEN
jgi:predicted ATPase